MIILEKPYISEFLISTLENNRIPVVRNSVAEELAPGRNLLFISENEAIGAFSRDPGSLLYTNSENSINWIENKLAQSSLTDKIKLFKNKVLFRDLLRDMYPGYFYKGVKLGSIETLDVSSFPFPFIIKPAVGFFSLGVYKVDDRGEWEETVRIIKKEIDLIKDLYPPEVLDVEEFIIEHCIEGDEFAIDMYFDAKGNPVVLNIMKHVFASGKDVNDRVYITSKAIIEQYHSLITDFIAEIGKRAGLKSFPCHVEVRITDKGVIAPIEVNPLRFGGWCSTPDLAWYAFGINLYEYLFEQKKPDWVTLLKGKEKLVYSNIVLNNSTGTEGKFISSFDYDKLLKHFEKPLELRKADFRMYPIFGFLFCETRSDNMGELEKILMSDLKEYI